MMVYLFHYSMQFNIFKKFLSSIYHVTVRNGLKRPLIEPKIELLMKSLNTLLTAKYVTSNTATYNDLLMVITLLLSLATSGVGYTIASL